eukprot:19292-Prymnesium_polylepis.2
MMCARVRTGGGPPSDEAPLRKKRLIAHGGGEVKAGDGEAAGAVARHHRGELQRPVSEGRGCRGVRLDGSLLGEDGLQVRRGVHSDEGGAVDDEGLQQAELCGERQLKLRRLEQLRGQLIQIAARRLQLHHIGHKGGLDGRGPVKW